MSFYAYSSTNAHTHEKMKQWMMRMKNIWILNELVGGSLDRFDVWYSISYSSAKTWDNYGSKRGEQMKKKKINKYKY